MFFILFCTLGYNLRGHYFIALSFPPFGIEALVVFFPLINGSLSGTPKSCVFSPVLEPAVSLRTPVPFIGETTIWVLDGLLAPGLFALLDRLPRQSRCINTFIQTHTQV